MHHGHGSQQSRCDPALTGFVEGDRISSVDKQGAYTFLGCLWLGLGPSILSMTELCDLLQTHQGLGYPSDTPTLSQPKPEHRAGALCLQNPPLAPPGGLEGQGL